MAKLRVRKIFAAVVIGASAVTAVAVPAMAGRQNVGGGVLDSGHAGFGFIIYSNYYHPSTNHGSSVRVNAYIERSGCVGPGVWSHAQWATTPTANDAAFWRYC
jgi:lactococcin 972 family bacteriocin